MNQEWDIQERAEACVACKKPFVNDETFFSKLSFGEGGYARQDCCAACWTEKAREGTLSVWRTAFRAPPPPPPEPLKKETAESLLRQFMESEDPSKQNLIFILAVMLERRRLLVERDTRRRDDGVKVRVYEHRQTGEMFIIPDPGLRLSDLEQVQHEVVALLGRSGETPNAPKVSEPVARDAGDAGS